MEAPVILPLSAIDPGALPRDRMDLDPEAQQALQASLLAEGLRHPVEVYVLADPRPPFTHGLISGLRRLTAFRALADMGVKAFSAIPAWVRQVDSLAQAMAAMTAENEIRADITPWEKANLVLAAVDRGHFAGPDQAIAGLYPHLTPVGRSRLRAVVTVAEAPGPLLADGRAYSQRQLLRIAQAVKAGFGEVIETALAESHDKTQPMQWELLQNILTEAELSLSDPRPCRPPGPKRLSRPRPGLTIRREWLPNGWRLVFTGPEAQGMMIESVMEAIERMYGPG